MDGPIQRGMAAQPGLGVAALLAFTLVAANAARAGVVSAAVTLPSCDGGRLRNCTDTRYLSKEPAGEKSRFIGSPAVGGAVATFASAFAAWNAANGDAWKLVDGGKLDLRIDATVDVSASNSAGGLSPVIFTLGGGSAALLGKLAWTQALVVNYTPIGGALRTPIETLDTFGFSQDANGDNPGFPKTCAGASSGASPSNGAFCGPIYPFQYGATLSNRVLHGVRLGVDPFYDAPQGLWPNASFEAVALLSSVEPLMDTLTVYQGEAYGFSLRATAAGAGAGRWATSAAAGDPVPETSTWAMALAGFAVAGLFRFAARRRTVA